MCQCEGQRKSEIYAQHDELTTTEQEARICISAV